MECTKNTSKIICNPSQKFHENMTGMNRQALNLQLSKQKGMDIRPACTFCKIRRDYPLSQESQLHFYSECLYTQRFWTEIKDWAQPPLKINYTIRDRLLGIPGENAYSMDNTLLREARSTIWGARSAKKLSTIRDLKDRLKRQIPVILMVLKNQTVQTGLRNLINMANT